MPDHGPNYTRQMKADENGNPTDEEIGTLGRDCGHHCGVHTSGLTHRHVGHCPCSECHGLNLASQEVPAQFTNETGGIDPHGIH